MKELQCCALFLLYREFVAVYSNIFPRCRVLIGAVWCRRASCSPTMAIMTSPRQQPAFVRGTDTVPSSAGTDNNRKIRLAATWQDVQAAIQEQQSISGGTAAYALYRLGCLYSFMTWQRRAGMPAGLCVEYTEI